VYIDEFGLCWFYSQSTGKLTHVNPQGNVDYTAPIKGYSGYGLGRDNPAMQNVRSKKHGDPAGPVPQGSYTIGPQRLSKNTGPATMNLDPAPTNNMFGRDVFRMHGDNKTHTASTGCVIFPRDVRDTVNKSKDKCLKVTP
jgi:hypothetical protein